jgi:hypothetical protein
MTNKIKIGEREYSTPFSYNINEQSIYSADGWRVCEAFNDSFGAFIVSALNDREEKKAAILKEREEIIAMLTDGSYCRAVEHSQNMCTCDEIPDDIRARPMPE